MSLTISLFSLLNSFTSIPDNNFSVSSLWPFLFSSNRAVPVILYTAFSSVIWLFPLLVPLLLSLYSSGLYSIIVVIVFDVSFSIPWAVTVATFWIVLSALFSNRSACAVTFTASVAPFSNFVHLTFAVLFKVDVSCCVLPLFVYSSFLKVKPCGNTFSKIALFASESPIFFIVNS